MARLIPVWSEVALDQYLGLDADRQALVDARMLELVDVPDGPDCRYDTDSDTWSATDHQSSGLIVYTFRPHRSRLIVLRLIYL